jgi:hypothetical protein
MQDNMDAFFIIINIIVMKNAKIFAVALFFSLFVCGLNAQTTYYISESGFSQTRGIYLLDTIYTTPAEGLVEVVFHKKDLYILKEKLEKNKDLPYAGKKEQQNFAAYALKGPIGHNTAWYWERSQYIRFRVESEKIPTVESSAEE